MDAISIVDVQLQCLKAQMQLIQAQIAQAEERHLAGEFLEEGEIEELQQELQQTVLELTQAMQKQSATGSSQTVAQTGLGMSQQMPQPQIMPQQTTSSPLPVLPSLATLQMQQQMQQQQLGIGGLPMQSSLLMPQLPVPQIPSFQQSPMQNLFPEPVHRSEPPPKKSKLTPQQQEQQQQQQLRLQQQAIASMQPRMPQMPGPQKPSPIGPALGTGISKPLVPSKIMTGSNTFQSFDTPSARGALPTMQVDVVTRVEPRKVEVKEEAPAKPVMSAAQQLANEKSGGSDDVAAALAMLKGM